MKFESWLRKQDKRQDAVGDVARDYKHASKLYWCKGLSLEESMSKFSPCREALEAAEQARQEYDKLQAVDNVS